MKRNLRLDCQQKGPAKDRRKGPAEKKERERQRRLEEERVKRLKRQKRRLDDTGLDNFLREQRGKICDGCGENGVLIHHCIVCTRPKGVPRSVWFKQREEKLREREEKKKLESGGQNIDVISGRRPTPAPGGPDLRHKLKANRRGPRDHDDEDDDADESALAVNMVKGKQPVVCYNCNVVGHHNP